MYVISILRNGEWVAWASTANPARLGMYKSLLRILHPTLKYKVDKR